MASGRQVGEENFQTFLLWMASKTDADYRDMTLRGMLARTEIAKECGFSKSALDQNPRIKAALRQLESDLRERGILPTRASEGATAAQALRSSAPSPIRAARDAERLKRLEQENASLRAENGELKKMIERFKVIQEALHLTGRMPR